MTKKEFLQKVLEGVKTVENSREWKLETLSKDKMQCKNVFNYAAWLERNFEKNLREDYTRKTTFTSDFSIAEWRESVQPGTVLDTFRRCVTEWKDNIEFFAELVMVLNMKCWEHHARKNPEWQDFYEKLYYICRDLYFEWFDEDHKKHDEAIRYYFNYVD